MYIELYGSSDRLGGNIVDIISQILFAKKNNCFIKFDRNLIRQYFIYNQEYNQSIFLQTLFDIIEEHNSKINNTELNDYVELAKPTHFEVLSRTTLEIREDFFSFFKENCFNETIQKKFNDRVNKLNYKVPFNPENTIIVHHRLEDVKSRNDYDGSICADFIKNKIENGEIPNNDILNLLEPSPWCHLQSPLSNEKLKSKILELQNKYPNDEVIIVTTPNEDLSELPYKVLSSGSEYYDLFLLCNAKKIILSRSNYALSSLFFGFAEEVYIPLWGHIPCYGLYTKFDKTNFKYFK